MDPRTDEELVAAIPGDVRALGELYDRHAQRMFTFALRRMHTPEEVADLVADVFLAVLSAAPRFDPGRGHALPWMYGVASNVVADRRRQLARRAGAELRRLGAAIATLSAPQRQVLELIALDDLSPAEVAEALGVSQVTVRARLARARRKLRGRLDPAPVSSSPAPVVSEV